MGGQKHFPEFTDSQVAPVTLTAGTTLTIVPAVTGKAVTLIYLQMGVATGGSIQILHGPSSTVNTAWSAVMTVPVGNFILDLSSHPWITASGEGIFITTVTTVAAGVVEFVQGQN